MICHVFAHPDTKTFVDTRAENKGGYIYDGSSSGKTYELKGKETHDGICHAKVPL